MNKRIRKIAKLSIFFMLILCGIESHTQSLTTTPQVPAYHPRVFIVPKDIPKLREKLNLPEFKKQKYDILNSRRPVLMAFEYLMYNDQKIGRSAIIGALADLDYFLAENGKAAKQKGRRYLNNVSNGACVYDWCYDLLTVDEKNAFRSKFRAIHKLHSPYYPASSKHDALSSHNAEGWFWNQLIVGLAIYDEEPQIFENASQIFFDNFQPARNWIYKSHLHHQDDYIGIRLPHALLAAFLYKKISNKDIWTSELQYVPQQLLYGMRPDQSQIRRGDVSDDSGIYEGFHLAIGLTADYYNDPYLYDFERVDRFAAFNKDVDYFFCQFLFRKPNRLFKPFKSLPLVKYFGEPVGGEMIMRTNWDISDKNANSALVQMRIGNYWFGGHQGKGGFGHFSIYYKGGLAIRSGMWQGSQSKAWSQHSFSYYQQSIAHNSLLIYDPSIKNTVLKKSIKNDGGVRWPLKNELQPHNLKTVLDPSEGFKYAEEIAHEFGPNADKPEYAYISGDLTPGYNGISAPSSTDRAKKVTRSMVTFNTNDADYPCVFVVYDHVISTNPSFRKTWLLHTMKEPSITGNKSVVIRGDGYDGKMVSYTLLPENSEITKIGGSGKEFWIRDENFSPGSKSNSYTESGAWRIEVSPKNQNYENLFLHTMAVMDADTPEPTAEKILSEDMVGAKILDRVVLFSKSGKLQSSASFYIKGDKQNDILICNLEPGEWVVTKDGILLNKLRASKKGKCIYFKAMPGNFSVQYVNENNTANKH